MPTAKAQLETRNFDAVHPAAPRAMPGKSKANIQVKQTCPEFHAIGVSKMGRSHDYTQRLDGKLDMNEKGVLAVTRVANSYVRQIPM